MVSAPSQADLSGQSRPDARVVRTRTGCWTCRTRSVKCDEGKPACKACVKMGLSCRYGIRLQWIEDSVARGICHGRERKEKKRAQQKHSKAPPSDSSDSSTASSAEHATRSPEPGRQGQHGTTTFFVNTSAQDVVHYLETVQLRSRGLLLGKHVTLDAGSFSRAKRRRHPDDDDQLRLPCTARSDKREPDHRQQSLAISSAMSAMPLMTMSRMINPAGLAYSLEGFDGMLLQFYDQVVCPSATLLDDKDHNPFRFVILPMVGFSSNILTAVLAIGATKMAYGNSSLYDRALVYRHQVLANLSSVLEYIRSDVLKYVEALASALILCWCDITDHCQSTWTQHLMGLASILDACPEEAYRVDYACGLIQTCRQYLVYHLIMAKATFRTKTIFPTAELALSRYLGRSESSVKDEKKSTRGSEAQADSLQLGSSFANDPPFFAFDPLTRDMHQIETNQGFSNALLILINDICDLANVDTAAAEREAAKDTVAKRVASIEESLQTLIQLPPRQDLYADDMNGNNSSYRVQIECGEAIAEANRLTALLFLDEMCALYFSDEGGMVIVPSSRVDRQSYIEKILSLVEAVCEKGPVTAALPIWPVFVAGCMVAGEDDRLQVLRILDKFQGRRIFGSIPPACAVIENVWRQRDLGSDENPRKPLGKVSLLPDIHPAGQTNRRGRKRKRTGAEQKQQAMVRTALGVQYPWETAMFVLRESILSLT